MRGRRYFSGQKTQFKMRMGIDQAGKKQMGLEAEFLYAGKSAENSATPAEMQYPPPADGDGAVPNQFPRINQDSTGGYDEFNELLGWFIH